LRTAEAERERAYSGIRPPINPRADRPTENRPGREPEPVFVTLGFA